MTKPLSRDRFYELRVKLGVVKIGKELQAYGVKCKQGM
jgi:hypothetical protein